MDKNNDYKKFETKNILVGSTQIEIQETKEAPIGSIIAYLKNFTNTPLLPLNWVECNGQTISDEKSVYNGITIPNLNGENRFLRGNSTSGGTGGSSTHTLTTEEMPTHNHYVGPVRINSIGVLSAHGSSIMAIASSSGGYNTGNAGSSNAHENKPPYYDVVWIMRIR